MTTLTTPQRVIIFGGSNAKRIVPFLLKLTKGKGIRIEDRTVSGHSLKNFENLPKNTEVRKKDFIFILSGVYHRERILKTSTLSCNEEKEEITKPPTK